MDWVNIYREQKESGWCGPAVIQMALIAGGIKKPQSVIAKETYHAWWGTTQQTILAYISQYFSNLGVSENSTISSLLQHLEKGRVIIVNWWDNIDPADAEGHYSVVSEVKENKITLLDPSAGRGIWKIDRKKFETNWYDYLDVNKKIKLSGWMLWVDPNSKV